MQLSDSAMVKARAIKRALERAHEAHPNSLALNRLHRAMENGVFELDLPDDQRIALGGGTNKDDDGDGGP